MTNRIDQAISLLLEDSDIRVGDKVRFSPAWLQSVGINEGPLLSAIGQVFELTHEKNKRNVVWTKMAVVDWNDPDIPEQVFLNALVKAD